MRKGYEQGKENHYSGGKLIYYLIYDHIVNDILYIPQFCESVICIAVYINNIGSLFNVSF